MEATLVIVTLLSLALAIGMAIVTWRLLQDERRRADARVAALEEGLAASLAANPPVTPAAPAPMDPERASRPPAHGPASTAPRTERASGVPSEAAGAPIEAAGRTDATETATRTDATEKAARAAAASPGGPLGASDADADADSDANVAEGIGSAQTEVVELHDADDSDWLAQFPSSSVNGSPINGTIARANGTAVSGRPVRSAHAGVDTDLTLQNQSDIPTQPIAVPVTATDSFAAAAADRLFTEGDAVARASERSRGVLTIAVGAGVLALILAFWWVGRLIGPGIDPRTGGTGVATVAAAPLELVSLEQTREGDALTIHGVVRNPHAGSTVDGLAAVVAFFDATGKQQASVRAPLDFRTLAPGDESPFQVTTTVPAGVTRYRVSFRRDEGTIVPHVDRRQQEAS